MPKTKKDEEVTHWTKQLYFYLAVGLSILFIAIGSYIFLYSNLTRFVFTKVDVGYNYYIEGCNVRNSQPELIYNYTEDGKGEGSYIYNKEQCEDLISEAKDVEYQESLLNSLLMISIAGIVLGVHLKYFRPPNK